VPDLRCKSQQGHCLAVQTGDMRAGNQPWLAQNYKLYTRTPG